MKDYNNADQVLVAYPNKWKDDEWVLLDNVRNAAPEFDAKAFAPVAGDVVEAQAKSSDDEPYSWWKATVKTVRGEFYMISYSSWEDEFNEILEGEWRQQLALRCALLLNCVRSLLLCSLFAFYLILCCFVWWGRPRAFVSLRPSSSEWS